MIIFKKIAVIAGLLFFLFACSSSKKISKLVIAEKEVNGTASELFSDEEFKKGSALVKASDCLTCHKMTERFIGPAFQQIANKYSPVSTEFFYKLRNKIIEGGFGPWGNTPMAPHPGLKKEDAETMVKYILLTKYKSS
jgi:cytochrome c